MPDFTQPGPDGERAEGMSEFQRGLIYTLDPRILAPLESGEEYRIVASTLPDCKGRRLHWIRGALSRARRLIDRRRAELTCARREHTVHTWIQSHGWFRMDIAKGAMVGAAVTLGAACVSPTAHAPRGEEDPTSESLRTPYVAQLSPSGDKQKPWFDEFYNDFDARSDPTQPTFLTISYGEYVPSRDGLDFTSLVARAEDRARAYLDVVRGDGEELRLAGREWTCLVTDKILQTSARVHDVAVPLGILPVMTHTTACDMPENVTT